MATLDFNKAKKQYLTITLPDEANTTVMVSTPTKATLEKLLALESAVTEETADMETIGELYGACAYVLSHNKGGVKVTKELLEEVLDLEDIVTLLKSYMKFVGNIVKTKN